MAKCNIVWITTRWTRWPHVKHTQCLEQWRSLRRWGMHQSVISSLNLAKGYRQIPIAPDSLEKTVLKNPFGLYEFKVMPLVCIICLQHSRGPPCWHLLCGCQKFAQAYLDDITVFSLNWQEHLQHLQEMLVQNQLAGFKVSLKMLFWPNPHALSRRGCATWPRKCTIYQALPWAKD